MSIENGNSIIETSFFFLVQYERLAIYDNNGIGRANTASGRAGGSLFTCNNGKKIVITMARAPNNCQ